MNDNNKTREQLIEELSELRHENSLLRSLSIATPELSFAEMGEGISDIRNWHNELMEQTRDVIFLLSTDGTIVSLNLAFEHITDRKQNEEALAHERNLLMTLVDLLPAFIYIKDRESRFQIVNIACANYMGASSPKELIGRTDMDFYQPEVAAAFREVEMKVLEGISIINQEQPTISSDGTLRILLTTKVPLRDKDMKIIGLVGTSIDITEAKHAENALRESEENFRALFDESPLSTIISEMPSGKITRANKRMVLLMGRDAKDICGKTANAVSYTHL